MKNVVGELSRNHLTLQDIENPKNIVAILGFYYLSRSDKIKKSGGVVAFHIGMYLYLAPPNIRHYTIKWPK